MENSIETFPNLAIVCCDLLTSDAFFFSVLFPFEEKAEFVYKLTVSKGRLLAIEDDGVTLSTVCDTGGPDPDRLLVFNSVTNVTWIVDATPTNVIPVKLT